MKKIFKYLWSYGIPCAVIVGLMFFDQISQRTLSKASLGGWAWIVQQAVVIGLFIGALSCFAGKWSKIVYIPLCAYLSVVVIVERYVMHQFGVNFLGDWLLLVQSSSTSEMLAFWHDNVIAIFLNVFVLIFVAATSVWLIAAWQAPRYSWKNVVLGVVLITPFVFLNWRGKSFCNAMSPCIAFTMTCDTFKNASLFNELGRVRNCPELPEKVMAISEVTELPTCVFVIGESSTRNNWHIYGYERDTTPYLDSITNELCVFKDVLGVWNQTPMAMRYTFTAANFEDKLHSRYTLAQICKRAGYPVSFYSRQPHWGQMDNMITYVFDACDKMVYLDDVLPKPIYDEQLMPYFEMEIKNNEKSGQVIFLHTYGSHYPYKTFYPISENFFNGGNETIDAYDNTIRYTDKLLGLMIEQLKSLKRPAMLFYLSDHGETPRSSSWRFNDSPDLWELPVFFWFSQEYREQFHSAVSSIEKCKDMSLQLDQLLPLINIAVGVSETTLTVCPVARKSRMTHCWTKEYSR